VRIRALSVFEGIVYQCYAVDRVNPARPTLEVDARTQPGDLDCGPLLVTVADWARMVGDDELARRCLTELASRGRLRDHLGVQHVAFPTWTPIDVT
jgi:hypothetical protein